MRPTTVARPATRAATAADAPRATAGGARLGDPQHDEAIVASHERCVALGVTRIESPDFGPVPRSELSVALERNRRLHGHAAPVMEMLHEQIARTESMVVLTDSMGTIIHAIGDDDFLARASKVALRPGANWSEGSKGTNAVGTALVDEKPTLVHADEHFLHANQFLTCSAAPIQDPRGNMLGVLDVSGDHRSYHKHTLALVRMSARMIENRWLSEDFGHAVRLHFHARPEFIGTLMEGLLAVADDGRVVGANRGALEQLRLSGAAVRMHTLESLFGVSLAQVSDHCRRRVAAPLELRTSDGRVFSGFARGQWAPSFGGSAPAQPAVGAAASSVVVAMPAAARTGPAQRPEVAPATADGAQSPQAARPVDAEARSDALARLQTGDPAFDAVVTRLRCVLDRQIPVLIVGDTGSGKETLARALHADSTRSSGPFVAVHCDSMPSALIEAELLGSDNGPPAPGTGRIEQAHRGTLFLDDVDALPPALQAQLLRVLEERLVTPLGSSRSIPVDVSIVCASREPLRRCVEQGRFREDLYYRLNGLAVRLPPLRQRRDLRTLVQRLLAAAPQPGPGGLAPDVWTLFERYRWPGNLRQLEQVLRSACALAGRAPLVQREHLPDELLEAADERAPGLAAGTVSAVGAEPRTASDAAPAASPGAPSAHPGDVPATGRLEDVERALIERTLEAAGGNISEAAKRLGVSRNTIYRKLRWNQRVG